VSCFGIENDFVTEGNFVFEEEVDDSKFIEYGKSKGQGCAIRLLHCMVLIGVHIDTDGTGKTWFLLQNFWGDDYF
jgi:aminopeptidase C